jgi:hypothetical protein
LLHATALFAFEEGERMSSDSSVHVLGVVLRGQEAAAIRALGPLVGIARTEHAHLRLAYFHPMPRPRVNGDDRVVIDQDMEMGRIVDRIGGLLHWATRRFDDAAIETVVRFGAPRREVAIEIDEFRPQMVASFTPRDASLAERWRAWMLRRTIAPATAARLLVFETPALDDRHLGGYRAPTLGRARPSPKSRGA